jgi:hypothetical protein
MFALTQTGALPPHGCEGKEIWKNKNRFSEQMRKENTSVPRKPVLVMCCDVL